MIEDQERIEGDVIHVTEQIASTWVGNMMPVRVLDGAGTGVTMDEGHVLGYLDSPSLLLLHEDGTTASWSTRLPWQYIGHATPRWRQEELIAAMQPRVRHRLLGEAPRSWNLPAEPGPEVTRVRDNEDEEWHRARGGWAPADPKWSQNGMRWRTLLDLRGPLTDATPPSP